MMMFKAAPAQEAELDALLEAQQNPSSPNFHKWLGPEEFADRFGLSANDVSQVVAWLQQQGFTIDEVGRARRWVAFSGVADQVEKAFQTEIHEYMANGQTFYANAGEPAVPAAFAEVVSGFRALNNFQMKPRPRFTSNVTGNHYLSPSDFATIYNLNAVYARGIDGRGQKIAVVGQTDLQLADIRAFRTASGLPQNDPQVILVPGSADPGTNSGDLGEADLDVEWSGAVAPAAQIIYVNSKNGAFDSLQYAVDQNLAPVISVSYGACEQEFSTQDASMMSALGAQANAQGITIVAASGDTGAADCETHSSTTAIATHGLAVDIPASLPSVTGVGGTEFHETSTSWTSTNNTSNGSAMGYMSENAWNDTTTELQLSSGGGGRSKFYSKPSWQVAAGVPADGMRDVPDVSMNASASHDGYLMCTLGSCANGYRTSSGGLTVVGGTSAGAPTFAGMIALINQVTNTSQGNINPNLYRLATLAPNAFHDVTSGSNQVPCLVGTTDCSISSMIGYTAAPGYDQATGLGSVDANNLIAAWTGASTSSTTSTTSTTSTSSSTTTTTSGGTDVTPVIGVSGAAPLPITGVEQGTVRSGYVVITPDSGSSAPTPTATFGLVSAGIVRAQAGVLPLPLLTDGSVFVEVVPGIGRDLGVAIANPSSSAATVSMLLRDETGNVYGTPVTITLQPQQQVAKFVEELFSGTTLSSGFRGTLRIQSATPLAMLGLRFSGAEFSTLQVNGSPSTGGIPVRTLTNGTVGGTNAILLPQFAMSGGWATQIALLNTSATTATGRVDIFDTNGNPMTVTLNGVTQSTFKYSISAGGAFLLAPRDINGQSPF